MNTNTKFEQFWIDLKNITQGDLELYADVLEQQARLTYLGHRTNGNGVVLNDRVGGSTFVWSE